MKKTVRAAAPRKGPESEEVERLLLAADAMIELTHNFNNSLNTIVLQAAVIQMKVDESLKQELAVIRKEGAKAAACFQPLLRLREQLQGLRTPVDLNAVLHSLLAGQPALAARVEAQRAKLLPALTGNTASFQRLLRVLLRWAAAWHGSERILVQTMFEGGEVHCIISAGQGGDKKGRPFNLLEPAEPALQALDELERLAVHALLRQTRGKLQAVLPEGNSSALQLTWAPSTPAPEELP